MLIPIMNQSTISMSPPTSPLTPIVPSTLTSHFVQALHDYLPSSSSTDDSVTCLFFKKGSIIEVFNRDDSGWWDGQSGDVRGWFPSNYVGRIGELKRQSADFEDDYSSTEELELWHQKMNHVNSSVSLDIDNTKISSIQNRVEMARALLREDRRRSGNSIILEEDETLSLIDQVTERVHDLVEACNQQQSNIQLIVFQVVSSIRSVLTEANIVNKESQILRNYPDLAKQRKLVLSALSRLVLKGKELQQQQDVQTQDIDQLSDFANQLLYAMESFERLLASIPRHSFYSSTDSDYTTRPSSMFHDTPRSSISSLGHSSVISTNSTSLRQIISEARHNNSNSNTNSLIKPVPTDTEHILQNISDHQFNIDDLMKTLIITLEKYLLNRIRATDMLEITRKAVESVRTFLAIVEHVCSNLGDLDYNRRLSMIPEDPRLVSLVLTKESVYSAITNLVTAVRALTGPQLEDGEEEHYHLPVCCQIVIETTNECADCVRACLEEEEEEENKNMRHPMHQQLEQQQHENSRSHHTLSILGRKVTSLQALQQYELDQVPDTEKEIEALAIEPSSITSTGNTLPSPTIEKCDNKKTRASLQINTTVEALPQRTKLRARAASVNNIQNLMSNNLPLPPLPLMKPSVSATPISTEVVATTDVPLKLRRSRGRSVSSLRPSINKSKSEHMLTSTSTDSLPEPLQPQKLSSWRSAHSSQEQLKSEPMINSVLKKEPEYEFLKQYVFNDQEMIFNAEGEVTGATVEALVRKLTLHEKSPDLIFTRAFFYNFRLFTNPTDFVQLLITRFCLLPPADIQQEEIVIWSNRVLIPIRLRVYNVIKTWLETYFNYEQDAIVEKSLMDFANTEMTKAMPGPAKRMIVLITRTFSSKGLTSAGRKHSYNETRMTMQKLNSSNLQLSASLSTSNTNIFSNLSLSSDHHGDDKYPPSILGKSLRNTLRKAVSHTSLACIHVNDIDPIELARQITLMENSLFCQIRPNEMIGQEFKKKVGTSQAIHVKAMIQTSTQITSLVSDTILNEPDPKKRAHVLKYWIKVGDACLQLNNYNTLMAIRSALDSTSIARLKKTWEYVSGKYKTMWEPIYRATDSQRNFAEYRQRLKMAVAPCLPFLGVYLTDMTFIDDGNADRRNSPSGHELINFDKYVKITRILNEIDQFQISYKLLEVEEIQIFLKRTLESVEQDDQVFYARSLKREPKEEE
ncbi:ras guanine nucleotide exchange factor domain-containing protein [Thamnidium elegans]|nr:ras guanine nucleotide exchange factor domain-containing protein [Thamnidium elegans]